MKESSVVEFKRVYTDDIKKEILAFVNTSGGSVYIGINDEGKKIPLENVDETILKITNSLRDSIRPDATMFVKIEYTDKTVIVKVQEGTRKPYYLTDKGLKPSGVYVRQGTSSAPASFEEIRNMIKLSDGDEYEQTRSLEQDLTFNSITAEFETKGLALMEAQMRTLGLLSGDKTFTNLGQLLSDQCRHSIKFAVFKGVKKGEFKTRKEMDGSLITQMRAAFDFLQLNNNLVATFSGLDRIEQYDYPEEVLREAMLNAIIHREYSFSGSTIVNIYDDRIEFVSLGGLVAGLVKEDLFLGISQPRNEKLANVFYRLKHIEAYGTGVQRIMQHYETLDVQPEIKVSQSAFVLVIPNINYHKSIFKKEIKMKKQHEIVMTYLKGNDVVSNKDIQTLLNVKQTRAYAILHEMTKVGLIEKKSSNKDNREYVVSIK